MKKERNPMKTKFRIGLFLFVIVILYLIYGYTNTKALESEINSESVEDESVQVGNQTLPKDCYYLYDVNGYVVVFLSDKKTIYEYTDILTEDLPSSLVKEMKNGKYVKNLEELYGFLENYSS